METEESVAGISDDDTCSDIDVCGIEDDDRNIWSIFYSKNFIVNFT